jgi:hypothetical protein
MSVPQKKTAHFHARLSGCMGLGQALPVVQICSKYALDLCVVCMLELKFANRTRNRTGTGTRTDQVAFDHRGIW